MADQPFWGQRVATLGVGPRPLPRKKLTANQLAAAISESVSNTKMQQQAHDLGQKIQAEDGIGEAIALIDRFTKNL
jgi:UDP:flavonoid glycosyltransferase YjiC (YdhE family)